MKFSIFLALLPVSRFSSKNDPNYTLLETLQLKTYTLVASTMTEKSIHRNLPTRMHLLLRFLYLVPVDFLAAYDIL